MGKEINPRLRDVMAILVEHLHAAVREAGVTPDEWMTAIQFLTETGHLCSESRQEFILLSDVLGVSMLVDAINHQRPAGSTENTVLGPFHVSGAPRLALGVNISLDGKGEPLLVHGRVTDIAGRPVAGATLDVWQANADGFYDVQQKGIPPNWNLRGIFETDPDGAYWFRSAKPRWYPIPVIGPSADCSHPWVAIPIAPRISTSSSRRRDTTGSSHIYSRPTVLILPKTVFGVKSPLIADFKPIDDEEQATALGFSTPFWDVQWNFVLAPAPSSRAGEER